MANSNHGHGFTAVKVEGSILPTELFHSVAALRESQQKGVDYGLTQSLVIKEEIARYWRISSDLYKRYAIRRMRNDLNLAKVGIEEWLVPFLSSVLGYDDLTRSNCIYSDDRVFKLEILTILVFGAPWKGAFSQWVRIPLSSCRFGW